jgi:hypothetical protein
MLRSFFLFFLPISLPTLPIASRHARGKLLKKLTISRRPQAKLFRHNIGYTNFENIISILLPAGKGCSCCEILMEIQQIKIYPLKFRNMNNKVFSKSV